MLPSQCFELCNFSWVKNHLARALLENESGEYHLGMSATVSDCIFCKIVNGAIPARKIYEDEDFLSFLDIFPASRGHALVIPKAHHQDIQEISEDLYGQLALRAKRVSDILLQKLTPEGVTVFQMNKHAGWQSVFHIHFHVIPRWAGDGLRNPWIITPGEDSELNELHQLIGVHSA